MKKEPTKRAPSARVQRLDGTQDKVRLPDGREGVALSGHLLLTGEGLSWGKVERDKDSGRLRRVVVGKTEYSAEEVSSLEGPPSAE